ncbi:MAG: hypothetical protein WC084_08155, partial [Synergistaceae bacterium]
MKVKGIHSALIIMFAIVIASFSCLVAPAASDAAVAARTIKLAHVLPPDSNFDIGAQTFKE